MDLQTQAKRDITKFDQHGKNTLHYAAFSGNLKYFHYLLRDNVYINKLNSHNLNVNPLTTDHKTCIHFSVLSGNVKMLELILNLKKKHPAEITFSIDQADSNSITALELAYHANRLDMMALLIKRGADVTLINKASAQKGKNLLMLACSQGNDEALEILLKAIPKDIKINFIKRKDSQKRQALHMASHAGSLKCVKLLIKHAAWISPWHDLEFTPLQEALKNCVLQDSRDLSITRESTKFWEIAGYLLKKSKMDKEKQLNRLLKISLQRKDKIGLHFCFCHYPGSAAREYLDEFGRTAMHYAILSRWNEGIILLSEHHFRMGYIRFGKPVENLGSIIEYALGQFPVAIKLSLRYQHERLYYDELNARKDLDPNHDVGGSLPPILSVIPTLLCLIDRSDFDYRPGRVFSPWEPDMGANQTFLDVAVVFSKSWGEKILKDLLQEMRKSNIKFHIYRNEYSYVVRAFESAMKRKYFGSAEAIMNCFMDQNEKRIMIQKALEEDFLETSSALAKELKQIIDKKELKKFEESIKQAELMLQVKDSELLALVHIALCNNLTKIIQSLVEIINKRDSIQKSFISYDPKKSENIIIDSTELGLRYFRLRTFEMLPDKDKEQLKLAMVVPSAPPPGEIREMKESKESKQNKEIVKAKPEIDDRSVAEQIAEQELEKQKLQEQETNDLVDDALVEAEPGAPEGLHFSWQSKLVPQPTPSAPAKPAPAKREVHIQLA